MNPQENLIFMCVKCDTFCFVFIDIRINSIGQNCYSVFTHSINKKKQYENNNWTHYKNNRRHKNAVRSYGKLLYVTCAVLNDKNEKWIWKKIVAKTKTKKGFVVVVVLITFCYACIMFISNFRVSNITARADRNIDA